jgi:hypothetical protein
MIALELCADVLPLRLLFRQAIQNQNNFSGSKKENPRDAATKLALNPKVQGGDTCDFLGFPSGGHAHQIQRDTAGLTFIGSRTCRFASILGQAQYNPEYPGSGK